MKKISLIVTILFFLSASAIARNVCNCKGYDGPGGPCYAGPGGGWSCPSVCSKCDPVHREKFDDQLLQNELGE